MNASTRKADSGLATRAAHRRAIGLMVCAASLWSIAGVVTRHLSPELQAEGRFEITFWRSLFAAVFVAGYLILRGDGLRPVIRAGRAGLVSGAAWAVMYTGFMLALTLTTVANTLLVMSISPLVTTLLARAVLQAPVARRTWVAIFATMIGMTWMFAGRGSDVSSAGRWLGVAVAFIVPLATAINLVTMQKMRAHVDLIPAVLLGGVFSAMATLPFMFPLHAGMVDMLLLALLGFVQLGLPCMLLVAASRHLSAPEISLLALLEVVLGPLWAWLGAGETPGPATLSGGALVLFALVLNEAAGLKARMTSDHNGAADGPTTAADAPPRTIKP